MTPKVLMKIPLPSAQAMPQMLGPAGDEHIEPLRIEFVGMKISHQGFSRIVQPLHRAGKNPLRQHPETSAARHRQSHLPPRQSGQRNLLDAKIVGQPVLRRQRKEPRNSVPPVMDGKDAGIILKSKLGKNLQRPQRIRANRKLRGPYPRTGCPVMSSSTCLLRRASSSNCFRVNR